MLYTFSNFGRFENYEFSKFCNPGELRRNDAGRVTHLKIPAHPFSRTARYEGITAVCRDRSPNHTSEKGSVTKWRSVLGRPGQRFSCSLSVTNLLFI